MTPAEHTKEIERAVEIYSRDFHIYCDTQALTDFRICSVSLAALQGAIRAGVGAPAQQKACNWSLMDEDNGVWESACGEAWKFIDGGPQDNNVRFCQGCGKPVAITAQQGDA